MEVLNREYSARGHWGKNEYGNNPWLFQVQRELGV